jgi:putative nucleotidyltransferase with HDIG domain
MITTRDIEALFVHQLARIRDVDLRAKVVETWVLGCKEGGWETVDELKTMPFTLLTDTKGVSFIEHTIAVTDGALGLAQAQVSSYARMPYEINYDRLAAGGLLHDVGKLLETEKDGKGGFRTSLSGRCARHPVSGAMLAARVGLPMEIINIIASHAKEGEGRPQTLETIFVHQADFATFDPLLMQQKGQIIK